MLHTAFSFLYHFGKMRSFRSIKSGVKGDGYQLQHMKLDMGVVFVKSRRIYSKRLHSL